MSRLEKPYVLLVDDNEATCTLVTALLQREFVVEIGSDGMEALERLRTTNYAAVILDLRMPLLDGFGVLDFLRDQKSDLLRRTLILTAALSESELARVRRYPICGVIPKPFEVETFLDAVKQCAGPDDERPLGMFFKNTGVILLIADLLRQKLM